MRFTIHFVNPKPKQLLLLWPITTDANIALNQSGFEAIACSQRQAQKKCVSASKDWIWVSWFSLVGKVRARVFPSNHREQQCKTKRNTNHEFCLRLSIFVVCTSKHCIQRWSFATLPRPAIIVGFQNVAQTEFLRVMHDDL